MHNQQEKAKLSFVQGMFLFLLSEICYSVHTCTSGGSLPSDRKKPMGQFIY